MAYYERFDGKSEEEIVAQEGIATQTKEFHALIQSIDKDHLVSPEDVVVVMTKVFHDQWAVQRRKELKAQGKPEVHLRPSKLGSLEEINTWKLEHPRSVWEAVSDDGVSEPKIDILNTPFEDLTPKWQQANADGARRVATIVHERLAHGPLTDADLPLLSEQEHIAWMLYPENSWKLENAKDTQAGNPDLLTAAIDAIKNCSQEVRNVWNTDPEVVKERDEVLRKVYAAAKSIDINHAAEANMQFGPYTEMSASEKLKDMEKIVAATRASITRPGTRD